MAEREDVDAALERLGEAASEAVRDLAGDPDRASGLRALGAIASALEEDEPAPVADPGLPPDYEVLGVLGRGSGGVVYRARQLRLGREVAVKVLLDTGDRSADRRRGGEARRLAGLRHEGIVTIHEVGEARAGVYLTLELHRSGTLQDLLAEGRLNPGHAARLTRQVAEAVAYVHGRGVVHLDLKPANVLLDDEGNARVADFGLAREADAAVTSTGTGGLLGTPVFMAPEQAANQRERIGEPTDVHGLGALLFTCLAGRPPFEAESLAGVLQAVQHDVPPRLQRLVPDVPADLASVVEVALAKDPAERYPSAQALAEDLARFEAGEPIRARPPGPMARGLRLLRARRRELTSAGIAVLLTLLALLPFSEDEAAAEDQRWLETAEELLREGETRAAGLVAARVGSGLPSSMDGRLQEVLEAVHGAQGGASAGDPGPVVEALVDSWILPDDGPPRRLWSGSSRARVGELLRVEGRGVFGGRFPGRPAKHDLLAARGPDHRWLGGRTGTVEAGGILEPLDDRFLWHITDLEVWVDLGPTGRGAFLDLASKGLLVGTTALLESRRCLWEGGGATLVMFGEARVVVDGAEPLEARDPASWLDGIAGAFRNEVAARVAAPWPPGAPDALRASVVDHGIALALLGAESERRVFLDGAAALAAAGVEPALLSEGLIPPGRNANVTRTGADLGEWVALASAGPLPPGPRMDSLPPPNSMQPRQRRDRSRDEWIWIAYILVTAALALITVLPVMPIFMRASTAGGALVPGGLAIGKTMTLAGGELEWTALACGMLALATWFLRRWTGHAGRAAAVLFVAAAAQALLVERGQVLDLRIPLVLAFGALAWGIPRLHPAGRGRVFARVAPAVLLGGYGAAMLVPMEFGSRVTLARALALGVMAVLFVATWAATLRATALQAEEEAAEAARAG